MKKPMNSLSYLVRLPVHPNTGANEKREEAIELIISGEIINYVYDDEAKLIVQKDVT